MIRKYILILLLFVSPVMTWGQFYFGANYSFDTPNKFLPEGTPSFDFLNMSVQKVKNRYSSWEFLLGYELTKNFSIESGIRKNKASYFASYDMGGFNVGGILISNSKTLSTDYRYYTFPLLMNIRSKQKDGQMYVKIGPQFTYLRSARCLEISTGGNIINSDDKTAALGYSFKDKYKTIVPELAIRIGLTFSILENVIMGDIGYSYERSLTGIEDLYAKDNLGRRLNRFTDISELREGPMRMTYYSKHYFYFGLFFYLGFDEKN